jgi:hypothetical protein
MKVAGMCPGKEESAEQNHSSRSAKGNKCMRRVLNQAAHAAVCKKAVTFRRCSDVCYPGWGISLRSGPWLIGSVVSFGRFCMMECDSSSKVPMSVLKKRRNVPRCWREHFASLAMRSLSPPSTNLPPSLLSKSQERIFDGVQWEAESRTGAGTLVSRWLLTTLSRRRLSSVWLGSVSCCRVGPANFAPSLSQIRA